MEYVKGELQGIRTQAADLVPIKEQLKVRISVHLAVHPSLTSGF